MALPEIVNLHIKQGDSWRRTLTLLEDDDTTPIDLTGCSVEFSIARARRARPSWTFTQPPHAAITDPPHGVIELALSPNDSRAFGDRTTLACEVTLTFSDGTRLTVLDAELSVRLEVADEDVTP